MVVWEDILPPSSSIFPTYISPLHPSYSLSAMASTSAYDSDELSVDYESCKGKPEPFPRLPMPMEVRDYESCSCTQSCEVENRTQEDPWPGSEQEWLGWLI
jgi:hypothetical protein